MMLTYSFNQELEEYPHGKWLHGVTRPKSNGSRRKLAILRLMVRTGLPIKSKNKVCIVLTSKMRINGLKKF